MPHISAPYPWPCTPASGNSRRSWGALSRWPCSVPLPDRSGTAPRTTEVVSYHHGDLRVVSLVLYGFLLATIQRLFIVRIRLHEYYYRIAGKFGGELNLAVWRSIITTAKLKSAKISYLHIYVWRSRTKQFWAQLPNLIPTNISGYTV